MAAHNPFHENEMETRQLDVPEFLAEIFDVLLLLKEKRSHLPNKARPMIAIHIANQKKKCICKSSICRKKNLCLAEV